MAYADPDRRRSYQREYQRLRRAGLHQTPSQTQLPLEFRLETARDVVDLIQDEIAAVLSADVRVLERARTVGYLATIALRAIETADIEARLQAVEAVLGGRGG
jgi:hypothetical protein